MAIDKKKTLSGIVSVLGGIELPGTKKIFALPGNLVFMIDTRDNLERLHNLSNGQGHEPYMIEKMMNFARVNETYVEVGAHYGDFSLRMSQKLGAGGAIYGFEPGRNLFECFSTSIVLNGIPNIKLENLAVLDKMQEIGFSENAKVSLMGNVAKANESYTQKIMAVTLDSYFEGKESSIDIIRLDAEGSECKALRGAKKIIDSSPDIRLFVEWQSPLLSRYEEEEQQQKCLSDLMDEGFVFLDILNFDKKCGDLNYRFTVNNLIGAYVLEFLAIRENTLKQFIKNEISNDDKEQCLNNLLLTATKANNSERVEFAISQGADVNHIYQIEGTGVTALYMAAEKGALKAAEALLKNGANPGIKTTKGVSALGMSAQKKDLPMVKLFVDNGADIEISYSNNATALCLSAYSGSKDIVELLVKVGANKNVTVGGSNVFEIAIEYKHYDIARLLADSTDIFCAAIPEIVAQEKYAELCGEVKIDL